MDGLSEHSIYHRYIIDGYAIRTRNKRLLLDDRVKIQKRRGRAIYMIKTLGETYAEKSGRS